MKFAKADVLMVLYKQGDFKMKEIVEFLKDIFMMKESRDRRIGLSQFKAVNNVEKVQANVFKPKEVKLSDLMRKSV